MLAQNTLGQKIVTAIIILLLTIIAVVLVGNLVMGYVNSQTLVKAIESAYKTTQGANTTEGAKISWEYQFVQVMDATEGPFIKITDGMSTEGNKTIWIGGHPTTLKIVNQLGSEGWELVNILGNPDGISAIFVFKRQVFP